MSLGQSLGTLGGAALAATPAFGPLAIPIGAAIGGLFGGGGSSGNSAAKKAANKQHKYNKKLDKYNWQETQRGYEHAVEAQEIQKKNAEKNLDYQDKSNEDRYNHAMAIRKYDFRQANRARNQSIATARQQLGFNEQAAEFGRMQQQRAHGEQLIELLFSENQSLMEYSIATAGLKNQRRMLGVQERSMIGKAQNATQRSFVEELEAEGAAQARGAGRTNAKAMQAAVAKAGANQRSIADELMFGLQGLDISTRDLGDRAAAMKAQLKVDQLMLEATRDNLDARTASVLRKIAMDKEQADAIARAKIHLKPELSPAMPKPLALPRPKYQDVYKPKRPPKPKKMTSYSSSSGAFGQAIGTLAAATPSIVSAFSGGGYQPNMGIGAVSSLTESSINNFGGMNFNTFSGFNGVGDFGVTGFNFSNYT